MKAFTLTEMLLIVVLLTVAAGLSLPNFSKSYTKLQLDTSVTTLTHMMRYAQSRAITQNKKIRLLFNDPTEKYQLFEEKEEQYVPLNGRWGKVVSFPKGITVKPLHLSIDFFPRGEIEKTDVQICQDKDCAIVTTQQQRSQIEVLYAN